MGYALASEAKKRGYSVVLVSGPVQIKLRGYQHYVENEMNRDEQSFDSANIIIMCEKLFLTIDQKIKKKGGKIKK